MTGMSQSGLAPNWPAVTKSLWAMMLLAAIAWPQLVCAQNWRDYYNQAVDLDEAGQTREAVAAYRKAIELGGGQPDIWKAFNNLGDLFRTLGQYDLALANLNKALEINPNYALAYNNRGNVWFAQRDYDKAISDYDKALVIEPGATTYRNRGRAWAHKGQYEKAVADCDQAIALEPNSAEAYNAAAWLQATCADERCRNAKKAFENANKAYLLDGGKDFHYIDTLAAAYAENRDFKHAVEWQTRAIALCLDEDRIQQMKARLDCYQHNRPWREEIKAE